MAAKEIIRLAHGLQSGEGREAGPAVIWNEEAAEKVYSILGNIVVDPTDGRAVLEEAVTKLVQSADANQHLSTCDAPGFAQPGTNSI